MRGARGAAKRCATIAAFVAIVACKKSAPAGEGSDAGIAIAPSANQSTTASAIDGGKIAARCTLASDGAKAAGGQAVYGDAVAIDGRVFFGVTSNGAGHGVVGAIESDDGRDAWTIASSTEVVADAPPPKPIAAGSALFAAAIVRGKSDAGRARAITIAKLDAGAKVTPLASFAQDADESFAFDGAASPDGSRLAIAWDDDDGIALAIASANKSAADDKTSVPRIVSPDRADVEQPRVVARDDKGGFWIAWIERRAEDDASAPRIEGPAEDRSFAWIDLVAVDASGSAIGALHRVTSLTGHAGGFDLATRSTGELDVLARDDTEAREASGGRVLHVTVRGDPASPSISDAAVLVDAGVGRGSIDVLAASSGDAWLSFFDRDDHARVAPLDSSRALAAPPSEEPALDSGRLLALVTPSAPARFVAAFPSSPNGAVRAIACAR